MKFCYFCLVRVTFQGIIVPLTALCGGDLVVEWVCNVQFLLRSRFAIHPRGQNKTWATIVTENKNIGNAKANNPSHGMVTILFQVQLAYLHDTEVYLSLRKRQQWADKLCTNIHPHDTFLTSTSANDSMTEHALLYNLWAKEIQK